MCGRVNVYDHSGIQTLLRELKIPIWPQTEPGFNISPMQNLQGIIRKHDGLQHQSFVWGIVPGWAKPGQFKSPLINARSETIFEKASFKNLIKQQRTIIPVNGFYEWQRTKSKKTPYYIAAKDTSMLFLAGIFQQQSDAHPSCCLITTHANTKMQEIHTRMPVIIPQEQIKDWLNNDSPSLITKQMQPIKSDLLAQHKVSDYVNNSRNKGEECMLKVG